MLERMIQQVNSKTVSEAQIVAPTDKTTTSCRHVNIHYLPNLATTYLGNNNLHVVQYAVKLGLLCPVSKIKRTWKDRILMLDIRGCRR
jgi:hypothetical protein